MEKKQKKQRLLGADFVRAVCAIGIVMFHFYISSATEAKLIYTYANGAWGGLLVTVFFIISGGMLYYNHSSIESVPGFYVKRWKSLFPPFYIAYIIFFIRNTILTGTLFWGGPKLGFLLSIIGMDGYFSYMGQNYYIIGEWFLGAIILLYLLYPLLLWCFNKSAWTTGLVIGAAYIWMCMTDFFTILPEQNLISCIVSFYMGMLLIKYRKYLLDTKASLAVALPVMVFLFVFRVPGNDYINTENILMHVQGMALFLCLYHLGAAIMRWKAVGLCVSFVGGLSYNIFLLQHMAIILTLTRINPSSGIKSFAVLLFVIFVTILGAWLLKKADGLVRGLLARKKVA